MKVTITRLTLAVIVWFVLIATVFAQSKEGMDQKSEEEEEEFEYSRYAKTTENSKDQALKLPLKISHRKFIP